ncbi:MAG: peptidylprolyl isomerase [Acidimicrobiales bacterium]
MKRLAGATSDNKALPLGVLVGILGLFVLGVAATGCDVSPPAATVDGATITQSKLDAQLSDVAQNQYARCAIELQGASLPSSVTGAGDSTVPSALASYELSTLVLDELVAADLARRHHSVGASEVSAATEDLVAQFESSTSSSGSPCPAQVTGRQLLALLPKGFSSEQVRYLADEEQLAVAVAHVDLSAAALERYYSTNSSQFAEVCLSDIALPSQAQAQSVLGAVSSGAATFADEARRNSTDTQTAQNGGAIPCVLSSDVQSPTILSAIASLAPGQVSQPVQATTSSGGTVWLLLQVNARPELPLAQVRSQIRLTLLSEHSAELTREIDLLTSRARVTVDPRYGSWSRLRGVTPPVAPAAKYLLSPGADQPVGSSLSLGG